MLGSVRRSVRGGGAESVGRKAHIQPLVGRSMVDPWTFFKGEFSFS